MSEPGNIGPNEPAAPREQGAPAPYQAAARTSSSGYLVVAGLVLLVLGFAWNRVEEADQPTSIVTIVWLFAALLLVLGPLAWNAVDWFSELKQRGAGRRAGAFVYVTVTIALSVVVFGIASVMNVRHKDDLPMLDLTSAKVFTLSQETRVRLDRVQGTVYLTYVEYDRETVDRSIRQRAQEQLKVYGRHSDRFVVKFLNADTEPMETTGYLATVGVERLTSGERQDVIAVTYAEPNREPVRGKQKEVRVDPYTFTKMSPTSGTQAWLGERIITGAIQELVFERFKVYATGGHGEVSLSEDARQLRERLAGQNLDVVAEPLDLTRSGRVPDDCNLLMILAPRTPFGPDEQRAVIDHARRGRGVLVCIDVDQQGRKETGLEDFLAEYGVAPRPNYLVMTPYVNELKNQGVGPSGVLQMVPMFAIPRNAYADHPAVRALREGAGFATVFVNASYLELETEPKQGLEVDPIIWAPELPEQYQSNVRPHAALVSKGRTEYASPGPQDRTGVRLPIAAVATMTPAGGNASRVAVVADGDMFVDAVVKQAPANLDFFTGLVQWSLKREDLIAVSEKTLDRLDVQITERQVRMAIWWPLVTTLMALLAGILVWWSRRR